MKLICARGHEWDYKGAKKDYATCPKCLSKNSIRQARKRWLAAQKRKSKKGRR
jgi:hypothetical protein